jgi:hypothetical protein
MDDEPETWRNAAAELGFSVVAPVEIELHGKPATIAALIRQFGRPAGMIVDSSWSVLEPHISALRAAGFGYACIELGDGNLSELIEVLRDWIWNGPETSKPDSL